MAERLEHEIAYYYDMHPTEEDLMGETVVHDVLGRYLMGVLTALFDEHMCGVYHNLNFYHTVNSQEYPLAPDIAVIKGMELRYVRSWRVGKTGPAPQVVVEIASEETWNKDLAEKPMKYALMGAQEYFAYDPNEPPLKRDGRRLFGWRLDRATRSMREMPLDPQGRLWSLHLESFLVPDNRYLRLCDSNGQLRLTQGEIDAQRADEEAQLAKAEARRADAGERRAEVEAQRADTEAQRADAEAQRAEVEARRNKALAEKLRSLGIDPDQI